MQDRQLTHNERIIFSTIEQAVIDNGYELVDVVLTKKEKQSYLTIYVFAHKNMSVDYMAFLSDKLAPILDTVECLNDGFLLEVSSPGINRVLKSKREFNIFKGMKVKIQTNDGKKYIGDCNGIEDNVIFIENVEVEKTLKSLAIDMENILKAKLFG